MSPRKQRDYKAEYARRVARAAERGYSKSVARGHAPKGVAGIKLAKTIGVQPGQRISERPAAPTPQPGQPTFIDRLTAAGFRDFLKEAREEYLRNLLKKHPEIRAGMREEGQTIASLSTSREEFVQRVFEAEHSEREAYTAWFSPR